MCCPGCLSKFNDLQNTRKRIRFVHSNTHRLTKPRLACSFTLHMCTTDACMHTYTLCSKAQMMGSSSAMKCTEEENKTAAVGGERKQGESSSGLWEAYAVR